MQGALTGRPSSTCIADGDLTLPTAEAGGFFSPDSVQRFLIHRPLHQNHDSDVLHDLQRLKLPCAPRYKAAFSDCRFYCFLQDILSSIDIPVMVRPALRAGSCPDGKIFRQRIPVPADVAGLAGRIERIHLYNLPAVSSCLVFKHTEELRP